MRAIVIGLVACCVTASSAEAAQRSEWVVLRVERVEVAVARVDGSPWDDGTATAETCGVFGGGTDLLASKRWGPVLRPLCPKRGRSDPAAPDLFVRLAHADDVEYLSPIAPDTFELDFGYEFLVPLGAIDASAIAISVHDADGAAGELLGSFAVNRRDVDRLLASADRVKTYSDDSVTRLDLSARRYRLTGETAVKVPAREQARRSTARLIAGESIEVRVSPPTAYATAVIGGNLDSTAVAPCTRGVVRASGGVAVGIGEGGMTVDRPTRFTVRRRAPQLLLWLSGLGGLPCDARSPLIRIKNLQVMGASSLNTVAAKNIILGRYFQGMQRCHEREVAAKRQATGKLTARFTVGPFGKVTKASVKGFSETLDSCMQSLMGKWRFGPPRDADGKPTSEDFRFELRLDEL